MKLATKTFTAWVGALALAVLTPLTASANLVSNPGFETLGMATPFADWTESTNVFDGGPIVHGGTRSALFLNDDVDPLDTLSQALSGLTVDSTYDFSFWLRCDGQSGTNSPCESTSLNINFSVLIGTQSFGLGALTRTEGGVGDNDFDLYSGSFKAIDSAPVLEFQSASYPESVYLDDVSVTLQVCTGANCNPIPEPGSLLLVGVALAAAAGIRRRKPA